MGSRQKWTTCLFFLFSVCNSHWAFCFIAAGDQALELKGATELIQNNPNPFCQDSIIHKKVWHNQQENHIYNYEQIKVKIHKGPGGITHYYFFADHLKNWKQ